MKDLTYPHPVIAERIQELFNEHDLTDEKIAKAIGAYRNCITNPSIKFVRYMCKTYNVSADWLLNLKEDI